MLSGVGSKKTSVVASRLKTRAGKAIPLALVFGLTVRAIRENQGWTQEAFADQCGFFRTYVSRIETGKANPTLNAIEVIALAVQLPVSDLIAYAERRQKP
jgi:transcriptional regulator with XRE-family HTH domain